jgi:transcription antitermination factor NusG
MSSCSMASVSTSAEPLAQPEQPRWYAVMTRAKHERVVAQRMRDRGLETFLPTITQTHRWSDRDKVVEVPLFSCYAFVKMHMTNEMFYRVANLDGVFRFVGTGSVGTPIPEEQIEAVQAVVSQGLPWSVYPFLTIGQRVRIRGGSMDGVEGILVARHGDRKLVVSIDAIQRSMAVQIEGYDLEPA